MWRREINVADGVEVACQLTLNKEMVLDYTGGPLSQGDPMLGLDSLLLALKTEEEDTNQGV